MLVDNSKWNKELKRFFIEASKASLCKEVRYLLEGNVHKDIRLIPKVLSDLTESNSPSKIKKFSTWANKLMTAYESGGSPPRK
jgi:hypothetical protein